MSLFEFEERLRRILTEDKERAAQSKLGHEGDPVGNHAALLEDVAELFFDVERDRVINGDREV